MQLVIALLMSSYFCVGPSGGSIYELTLSDYISKDAVLQEIENVGNRILCASVCSREPECKGFAYDALKTCSILNVLMDEGYCSKEKCMSRKGVKVYMAKQERTTTTTTTTRTTSEEPTTSTTKSPSTTKEASSMTEAPITTTTTRAPTTTTSATTITKEPTTTITSEPTTTTTTKPITTTAATTEASTTTTTKAPTTTTAEPTTTTTTTAEPSTTTTTTTAKPTTTTTTTTAKPTTTTTTTAEPTTTTAEPTTTTTTTTETPTTSTTSTTAEPTTTITTTAEPTTTITATTERPTTTTTSKPKTTTTITQPNTTAAELTTTTTSAPTTTTTEEPPTTSTTVAPISSTTKKPKRLLASCDQSKDLLQGFVPVNYFFNGDMERSICKTKPAEYLDDKPITKHKTGTESEDCRPMIITRLEFLVNEEFGVLTGYDVTCQRVKPDWIVAGEDGIVNATSKESGTVDCTESYGLSLINFVLVDPEKSKYVINVSCQKISSPNTEGPSVG